MSKLAIELEITNNLSAVTLPTYSSSTITLGTLMRYKTGATNSDNYVGPFNIGLARPMETSTAIPLAHLHVVDYDDTTQWVFGGDNATAAFTRRFVLYEYNKTSSLYTWKGFITVTPPSPGPTNNTVRGHRALYQKYTDGTVTVNGTAVSGSGTLWTGSSLCVGSRIGFGSTSPSNISTWYMITGITTNTALTLSTSAGVSGTPIDYVIEDLRIAYVTTNATAANGGLFIIKGLRYEDFSVGGNFIASAATDNQRAVYCLPDQNVLTNNAAAGIAVEDFDMAGNGWDMQPCYIFDTNNRVYKYNLRAWLGTSQSFLGAVNLGRSTRALLLSTGTQSVTGTLSQNNNGRIVTASHGPGINVPSLYYVTTTRIYRAALSSITSNNNLYQADVMIETPPGSTTTYAATGALNSLEYAGIIDRFIILSTHASGTRSYVTQYRTDSGQMDHIFLSDTRQIDQSTADANVTPSPNTQSTTMAGWSEGGVFHLVRQGTTAIVSQLYSLPINADWTYASTTNQRIIFPKFTTTGAVKFYRGYVSTEQVVGGSQLGTTPEAARFYARTTGIDDNTGGWTLLDDHLDLTALGGTDYIQFMAEFKTIGLSNVPNRIHSVTVVYEDSSTDSHYQPSAGNSDIVNKRFAWRFSTAFGSTVPHLRVRLYDAVSGGILVDDDTDGPTGTFEKSTDGGSNWVVYNDTDKANDTTYIRYTPAALADNIRVRALLTQL